MMFLTSTGKKSRLPPFILLDIALELLDTKGDILLLSGEDGSRFLLYDANIIGTFSSTCMYTLSVFVLVPNYMNTISALSTDLVNSIVLAPDSVITLLHIDETSELTRIRCTLPMFNMSWLPFPSDLA